MPGAASPVFLLKGGEAKMIDVTKVNGKKFTLNSRLIETIEENLIAKVNSCNHLKLLQQISILHLL